MKKWISLLLTAALLAALGVPAAAEPAPAGAGTDQQLAQVTVKVKRALGLGDEYEEFYGELWENQLTPIWNLNWSGPDGSLNVEATGGGKILGYYLYDQDGDPVSTARRGQFAPSFPAMTREEGRKIAEAFLAKVLDSRESAVFEENQNARLNPSSHRFYGEIRLNGLSSPLSFSLSVRTSDGVVTSFHRDILEGNTIGGVPSAKPAASQGSAGALLKDTLALRLEYVLDEDGETAVLRYLPEYGDDFYVDAQTGKLVNLTELYKLAMEKGFGGGNGAASADMAAPMAEAAGGDSGLSNAELAGIAKMEGVLSKEVLDQKLRAVSALGLGKYTLGSASYSLDQETGDVAVRISYSRRENDRTWLRTVTCDAKTGDLISIYSFMPYEEGQKAAVDSAKAQKAAEDFLTGLWGGEFAKTALYDSRLWEEGTRRSAHSFTYAQQENGYFLASNSITVGIDVTDGSVSELSRDWTEVKRFDSPEGIVDEAAALDAWFGHYNVALAYRNIPVQLDPGDSGVKPLIDAGYAYFYGLKLSYALEAKGDALGVDAKTGDVVVPERETGGGNLAYQDLEGHWAQKQIEALAQYGIGWAGENCEPGKELTQLDLVALLVSTDGWRFDPANGDPDQLYSRAYDLGILTRGERADDQAVTRGDVVKLLLGSGYRDVAALQGIFTCSFTDRDEIPAGLMGYAALAQGLGIVDGSGAFAATRTATRAEAAVMLYNLMSSPTFS